MAGPDQGLRVLLIDDEAGYLTVEKTYRGKIPLTICRLTEAGKKAYEDYRKWLKQFVDKP